MSSVLVTLGLAVFAFYTQMASPESPGDLNASLSSAASVDDDMEGDESSDAAYDLSAHQTLSRVILLIRENYVDPERIKPYDMFLAALDYIQKTVPEVIVDDSAAPQRVKVSVGSTQQSFDLGGLDQLWEVTMALRDIFRFLQTKITDPEQRRDIEYAAINGMLSTLDPHSVLLKPENFDEVKLSTKGEFGGLGIVISIRDGALTIISPIEDTPAAKAGLKAKDKIVKIGEESTVNMNLEEAVERLRGKPGSKANIWVLRKGWSEAKKYVLTRAIIKIESVSSELLADGVGYLRIKSFQNNTFDDLNTHLDQIKAKNNGTLKGLVLDLRNNPGGLLDQAILISDRFIEKGPLVITVGEGNRKREVKSAHASGTDAGYPIVVLVNGGSASASEIVSGALKNHNRAMLLGQQTFGKGSVQVLYDFKDRSALKLTIAQYLTPGDISIQSVGILPDVEVVPAVVEKDSVHLFVDDDSLREKDLEKHLDQHAGNNVGPASAPTQVRLVHLLPKEDPKKPEGEEEEQRDKFEYDFETSLAHDILVKATHLDRPNLVKDAAALLTARAQDQDTAVAKRMGEMSVDWSAASAGAAPARAEVELTVVGGSKAIVAGETLTLIGTVKNVGDVPLTRAYGVTSSENPLLKNLEFVFGKVMPGEKRMWEVKVKMPQDISARADSVSLKLGAQGPLAQEPTASAYVNIEEKKKPRFAYTMALNDSAKGNGDGSLQVGEAVDLKLNVRNLGPGVAEDVTVTLKNMSGKTVFLDQGREKLGTLKVGEGKTATLQFSVKAAADVAELRLAIWDGVLGTSLSETVKLPISKPRKGKADASPLQVLSAAEVPVYSGANDKMLVSAYLKPSSVVKGLSNFGDFWRIDLGSGVFGYVKDGDVGVAKGAKPARTGVRLIGAQAAPELFLDSGAMVTTSDIMRLQGSMTDEQHLKDVFVFVNDKKVFYRALDDAKQDAAGVVRAPLDVPLTLKSGSNSIAVVVRENDDVMTRRVFAVYNNSGKPESEQRADAAKPVH